MLNNINIVLCLFILSIGSISTQANVHTDSDSIGLQTTVKGMLPKNDMIGRYSNLYSDDNVDPYSVIQTTYRSTASSSSKEKEANQKRNFQRRKMGGLTNDKIIEDVEIYPFELIIGPTLHPFNAEDLDKMKDVITTTLIKNIPSRMTDKIPNRNNQLTDVHLAGIEMKYTGRIRRRHRHRLLKNQRRSLNNDAGVGHEHHGSHTTILNVKGGVTVFKYSIKASSPGSVALNEIVIESLNEDLLQELQTSATTVSSSLSLLTSINAYEYDSSLDGRNIVTNAPTASPTQIKKSIYWGTTEAPAQSSILSPPSTNDDKVNNNNNASVGGGSVNSQSDVNYVTDSSKEQSWSHYYYTIPILICIVCFVGLIVVFAVYKKQNNDFALFSARGEGRRGEYRFASNHQRHHPYGQRLQYDNINTDHGKIAPLDSQQKYDVNSIEGEFVAHPSQISLATTTTATAATAATTVATAATAAAARHDELYDLFASNNYYDNHQTDEACKETSSVSTNSTSDSSMIMRAESFEVHKTLDTSIVEKDMLNTDSSVSPRMEARKEIPRRNTNMLLATDFSASSLIKEGDETMMKGQSPKLRQFHFMPKSRWKKNEDDDDYDDDFLPDKDWDPNDNDTDENGTSPQGQLC